MSISGMLSVTAKVDGAYKAMCRPVLEEFGIPQTSLDIILFLANNPQHFTARQVSRMRTLKPTVVSIHVDRLVKEGLLKRQGMEEDRRKVRLILTEKAEPVIARGRQVQCSFYKKLVEGLSKEELENFRHCVIVAGENAESIRNNPEFCGKAEESPCLNY